MREINILCPPAAILNAEGEWDEAKISRYYNWMADHGVYGLFLNGSTGEFTILTDEQKVQLVRIAKAAVGNRMFLIGGAIAGSSKLVLSLANKYKEAGADAIALCPPPFFKHNQAWIVNFMTEIADKSPLPVYLYDIPAFSTPMDFDTLVTLSSHPNIHGLKDSSRDFARFQGLLAKIKPMRPDFKIYTGSEELLLAALMMGADGATIATSGIEPDKVMDIVTSWKNGDIEHARAVQFELLPSIRKWFSKDFPEGFRDAVAEKGFL